MVIRSLLMASVLFVGSAFAAAGGGSLTPDEVQVLGKLHHINQMEVEIGNRAKSVGQAPQVKSFGERLVKDHSASDKQVMGLAKEKGVQLPEAAEEAHGGAGETLKTATGKEFDEAFGPAMVEGHQEAITFVTDSEKTVHDPKVKALLGKTLPVLKEHLHLAQGIVKSGAKASAK